MRPSYWGSYIWNDSFDDAGEVVEATKLVGTVRR
jgi:hypothetical protein